MTDAPPNSKILDKVAAYKVKIMPSSSTLSKIVRDHAYCCGLICIMTFLVLLSGYYVTKETKTVCEERQKANIMMQIAEDLYAKANGLDPTEDKYTDPTNSKFRVSGFGFSHNDQTDKTVDTGSKISFRDLEPVNIPREVPKQSKKSKSRNSGKSESAKPADYNALPWQGAYTDPGDGPRDCSEILASGANTSGVYTIMPKSNTTNNRPLRVYCDMDTDGGGWTVIQRRGYYRGLQSFNLPWLYYKEGFGHLEREFWLGNDHIHVLTNQKPCEIRFDLTNVKGNHRHATYAEFRIGDETSEYKLHIQGYSGNANDGMQYHHGRKFATPDRDQLMGANMLQGAWWIHSWAFCHLNGLYIPGIHDPKAIHWYLWLENEGLEHVEMKVRSKDPSKM
ncbi:techylectin-5A [Caerostris darwini]|uniref:Techylectin-5A n=1 Tax=Caerostris darwini TaxID=1538125 RepID=A0AAV4RNU9_9ARAC|nr:techylectin-5A [Caerostris darwini]